MKRNFKLLSIIFINLFIFGLSFNVFAAKEVSKEKDKDKDKNKEEKVCDTMCMSNRYPIYVNNDFKKQKLSVKVNSRLDDRIFDVFVFRYFVNPAGQVQYVKEPIYFELNTKLYPYHELNYYDNEYDKKNDLELAVFFALRDDTSMFQTNAFEKAKSLIGIQRDFLSQLYSKPQLLNKLLLSPYIYASETLIYAPYTQAEGDISNDNKNLCYAFKNGDWNSLSSKNIGNIKNDKNFKELFMKYNPAVTGDHNFYKNSVGICYTGKSNANYSSETLLKMMKVAMTYKKDAPTNVITITKPNPGDYDQIFDMTGKNDNDGPNIGGLKCNSAFSSNLNSFVDGKYNYVNKNRYYASDKKTEPERLKNSKKTLSCEKVCEEKLIVEYGPPVASKAGLCFEYRVKVTSEVKCESKFNGDIPKTSDYVLCNPLPACFHSVGAWTGTQGGPNASFDSCVLSCDGGKYSKECTNKCYSKIYGDKIPNVERTKNSYGGKSCYNSKGERMPEGTGQYEWSGNNIIWNPGNGNYWDTYAAFYFQNGRGWSTVNEDDNCGDHRPNNNGWYPFIPYDGGFKKIKIGGYICDASCAFIGCSKSAGDYINESDVVHAFTDDLRQFETFYNKCKAATTCSNKTAVFDISIKYDNKAKDKNSLTFPFTGNYIPSKDRLSSRGVYSEGNAIPTNTSKVDSSSILSYAHCYDDMSKVGNKYLIEWSFPGTWIGKKDGNISYIKPTNGSYTLKKNKFCLPLDVKDVNKNWWKAYYRYKNSVRDGKSFTLTDDEKINIRNELNSSIKSNGYNINAKMEDFGYYGWDINVDCFYSVFNGLPDDTTPNPKTNGTINYIIRPIDYKNLFPNDDRNIGFNWNLSPEFVEGYNIASPGSDYDIQFSDELIREISSGRKYDSTHLDYQFDLSPENLKEIRRDNKNNKFGDWKSAGGSFTSYIDDETGEPYLFYYTSDLVSTYKSKRPKHGNKVVGGVMYE